jgi:hypothetical protein
MILKIRSSIKRSSKSTTTIQLNTEGEASDLGIRAQRPSGTRGVREYSVKRIFVHLGPCILQRTTVQLTSSHSVSPLHQCLELSPDSPHRIAQLHFPSLPAPCKSSEQAKDSKQSMVCLFRGGYLSIDICIIRM